jgi:hypothetical protein
VVSANEKEEGRKKRNFSGRPGKLGKIVDWSKIIPINFFSNHKFLSSSFLLGGRYRRPLQVTGTMPWDRMPQHGMPIAGRVLTAT